MTDTPVHALVADITAQLGAATTPPDDPRRAARAIITIATGLDITAQLAAPAAPISPAHIETAHAFAVRHGNGEPLSRIRGTRTFYDFDFALSEGTLDPRPETEMMVDEALRWIQDRPTSPLEGEVAEHREAGGGAQKIIAPSPDTSRSARHVDLSLKGRGELRLLDLGTGTGCIAIAILKHAPNVTATVTDISTDALTTARQNATTHGVFNRITFIESHWFDAVQTPEKKFDIIVSNPPYIPMCDIKTLEPGVRNHDPIRALTPGDTGLESYDAIFKSLDKYLSPTGIALFEIGYDQGDSVPRLAIKYGLDANPPMMDSAGHPRLVRVTIRQ
jgi:release factor glutamine methyltransferase